jgi:hypothetical protein
MNNTATTRTAPPAPARIQADRPAAPKGPHFSWPEGTFGRVIRIGR